MKPVLQVALDFVDLSRAMKCAEESSAGGVDWLEAGTPLIKSEGLNAIRKLREKFPAKTIVADMKIMDAGRTEVEIAAKSGANIVCVLGAASDATIKECVDAAHNYGAKIQVDLIAIKDVKKRALEVEKLGVDYDQVREGLVNDKRIIDSHFDVTHGGYRGYGGKCLPKDVQTLAWFARQSQAPARLIETIIELNDKLKRKGSLMI